MNVSALLPQAHQPARPKNVVTSNGKGCDICGDNARLSVICKTRGISPLYAGTGTGSEPPGPELRLTSVRTE